MTLEEMKSLAKEINRLNVDIVWIGLSTPKQELFACELAKLIEVHFVITVGAAFDFHIGSVRQAPQIIQRAGLEWLFRLMMEPRRLYRRYLEIVPYFLYYGIKDLLTTSFSNS
jgi:N-acetylglucosaminyldiphosphoundecaprenol N-acetyl-beta-D-mannosaminyltransferase